MNRKGFTLIELMLVVVIIAILASLAIPSYQQYLIRARIADGLHRAAQAQNSVADYTFTYNSLPSDQAQSGYITNPPDQYVESITVGANGTVIISYTPLAGNGTIIITPFIHPNGDISWDCKGGTLISDYRPPNCRP